MKVRSYIFAVASGLGIAVACILFYKTVLVDHSEFVSGAKLLAGVALWSVMVMVSWLSRQRAVPFWSVAILSLALVSPAVLLFVRAAIRGF